MRVAEPTYEVKDGGILVLQDGPGCSKRAGPVALTLTLYIPGKAHDAG